MILRYNQFILEKLSDRTTKLDEDLESIFKKYAPYVLDNITDGRFDMGTVYRGIKNGPEVFIEDPSKAERTSRNTGNYYTMMIDNSEYWDEYPNRKDSVICTTSIGKSTLYGETYRVIPLDPNSIFGVAPKDDIWNSFPYFRESFDNVFKGIKLKPEIAKAENKSIFEFYGLDSVMILKDFNDFLEEYFNVSRENTYEELKSIVTLETIQERFLNPPMDKLNEQLKGETLFDWLQYIMSPEHNDGFKLETFENFHHGNNEVWTDKPCLIIKNSTFRKFLREFKGKQTTPSYDYIGWPIKNGLSTDPELKTDQERKQRVIDTINRRN